MEDGEGRREYQKSYFDVLGICCPSEVPLVEKILNSMDGVIKVSVIVPTKTVIVVHDNLLISQLQIVRALNQARLEATVRAYGSSSATRGNWPSIYTLACGMLLAVSFLKPLFHPLKWLAVAAVLVGIPPIFLRSVAAARRFTVDINILLLIAVAGSLALKDFWEAGTIVFLFTIAEWLESRATYKATAVMSSLMSMAPQKAVLADSGLMVDARDVRINTILAVKAGEVIPIDGVVVEGQCEVDESSLTGESFPVTKQPQSLVWAGTNNINGYISVKTTALAEDSAAAKMTKLVEEAQNSKSRTNRMIDLCAKYYTPVIVLASVAVSVVPTAMRVRNLRHWFHLALVLLVSACPCALVLSTPVATFCALTKAATMGVLIKGGDYLEILAKTKVVAFDKTGTITRGEFTVMDFHPTTNNISKDTLLYWVSSIESKSSHPMATTLVDYAISNSAGPKPENVSDFKIFPGEGIYGEIDGNKIHIGNRKISTRASCRIDPSLAEETRGVTVGYIFSESQLVGIFSLSDTSRTGATQAIKEIKHLGAKTAMLTGDSKEAAAYVQNQLGNALDSVYAELLPEDKVRIINELKTKEGTTVMVGDGMNDAPALTAADVGVSMGISGSAVAMETSHITLMSNDLLKIPKAIRLAKKANRKIMENIAISVAAKGGILVLAFCGHPLLWAAVLADVGTCMLVIFNSMLLLQTRSSRGKHCCKSSHGHKSHAHGPPQHNEGKHCEQGHCGGEESFHKLIGSSHSCCSNTNHQGKADEDSNHKSTCGRQTCNTDKGQTSKIPGADGTHSCSGHRHFDEGTTHECTISVDCGVTHHQCSEHGTDGTVITDEHPTVPCHDEKSTHKCCTDERIVNVEHLTETHCGNSPCSSSHKGVEIHRREVGGCCKSYMDECKKKRGCCGNNLQPLSEIITE